MPTAGGRLEVATVHVREAFTRSDARVLLDLIDLGTTASESRVDATYRYLIATEKAWPLHIAGKTGVVQAGMVKPTLPVAFDSRTVERRTASGWA
jgi:predicted metal-dependent HD superfamily phosphohydrolase